MFVEFDVDEVDGDEDDDKVYVRTYAYVCVGTSCP